MKIAQKIQNFVDLVKLVDEIPQIFNARGNITVKRTTNAKNYIYRGVTGFDVAKRGSFHEKNTAIDWDTQWGIEDQYNQNMKTHRAAKGLSKTMPKLWSWRLGRAYLAPVRMARRKHKSEVVLPEKMLTNPKVIKALLKIANRINVSPRHLIRGIENKDLKPYVDAYEMLLQRYAKDQAVPKEIKLAYDKFGTAYQKLQALKQYQLEIKNYVSGRNFSEIIRGRSVWAALLLLSPLHNIKVPALQTLPSDQVVALGVAPKVTQGVTPVQSTTGKAIYTLQLSQETASDNRLKGQPAVEGYSAVKPAQYTR